MTPAEARAILRVGAGSGAAEIRAAYRREILAHHPDRNAGSGRATQAAAVINEAFRVLRAEAADHESVTAPPGGSQPPQPTPASTGEQAAADAIAVLRPDGDSIAVAAPADDVFGWLHVAVSELGAITYLDPESGLLEAQLVEPSGNVTSVVVSLQGRGDGTTEAFCSAERISGTAPVDLGALVDRIVERLLA